MDPINLKPLPSASDLFRHAFAKYKQSFWNLAPIMFIVFLSGIAQMFAILSNNLSYVLIGTAIAVIIGLLSYIAMVLIIMQPTQVPFNEEVLKKTFKLFGAYIWISILILLATIGGFAMFVIPGLIVSVLLSLSAYFFIEGGQRGVKALVSSWNSVRDQFWPVVWRMAHLMLVLLGASFVLAFFLFILKVAAVGDLNTVLQSLKEGTYKVSLGGSVIEQAASALIFLPFSLIYIFGLYDALKSSNVTAINPEREKKITNAIYSLAIVGVIAIIVAIFWGPALIKKYAPGLIKTGSTPAAAITSFLQ